jgi:hypothetical protein
VGEGSIRAPRGDHPDLEPLVEPMYLALYDGGGSFRLGPTVIIEVAGGSDRLI